jgi:hypothetical protein
LIGHAVCRTAAAHADPNGLLMEYSAKPAPAESPGAFRHAPWQIWVVVVLLGMEGVGNLLLIPDHPIALYWLSAKVLFITGLLKAWRWVFVLFVVVAAYHVIAFLGMNLIASAMNLTLVGLAISARRYCFPT